MKKTESSTTGTKFLTTFVAAFIAIAGLFAIDTFLARVDEAESHAEATRLFAQGRRLMAEGKNNEAAERLKEAIAIERENSQYELVLAQAWLAAGKPAQAQAVLADLLEGDSTDAQSNLLMARVLVREGKIADAVSYYHRAIYGHWNQNAPANRLSARFELIDLLAQRGTREELLAELLPVEEEDPEDTETRMRLGKLFLEAGSTMRAAAIFRSLLHDHPGQADALAGLGEAEFASGDYRGARNDFAGALRINPADREASARLEVCEQMLALDPARRGLNAEQRFERSRTILQLVVNEASGCVASHPSTEVQDLLEKARSALSRRITASRRDDVFESNIDLAEQLWQAAGKTCGKAPGDEPLALILMRLAQ
ncbi:MAG TPA: tetratricopeptide repeat protein [Bryobacteraceae bacterium]|nr:tetratricopeptide repeat protein [Bryobacteraceae bacterium]